MRELELGKYKAEEVVYAKENPTVKLIIRRFVDRIYYCKVASDPTLKEQVYYERELISKLKDDK